MTTEQAAGPLEVTIEGEVATVWLNRPAKRNAVTFEMWELLPEVLRELEASDARVVVVRGRGGHFCAGADITLLQTKLGDAGDAGGYRAVNALAEQALVAFTKPTLAVIEGNCIGGGWQIASACDLRLASSGATFGITPARLGITYPLDAIRRTIALIGPSQTKRLLFTADIIDAAEASMIRMCDILVDDGELEGAVRGVISTLLDRSLLTQMATKAVVDAISRDDSALDEIVAHFEAIGRDSIDLAEGLAAFGERRPASFRWRPT